MKKSFLFAIMLVCLISINVFAGRTWYYSDVTFISSSGYAEPITSAQGSAIAMRSDGTWPVVAFASSSSNEGASAMVPGGWAYKAAYFGGNFIDGTTAPNGSVGFVDNYGSIMTLPSGKGWNFGTVSSTTTTQYRNSIAYNKDSAPAVLYKNGSNNYLTLGMQSDSGWISSTVGNTQTPSINTTSFSLGFDSYNQANVAYRASNGNLGYAVKGVMTGSQWQLMESATNPQVYGPMDMAIASNDVPYVLYMSGSTTLNYSIYSRMTSTWLSGVLESGASSNANFSVAADGKGGVGVAYVTSNNYLKFAYSDGISWSFPETLVQARTDTYVGLTFDGENNPVISYMDYASNRLKIAYDPVVPEPATMALLALGFGLIRRK